MLMQRIVILGNSGSGKSTLAREIGKRLDLPVVHLDTLFWEPGWVEADTDIFRTRVRQAVAGDAWICEGNYSTKTFALRLPRAELIIWLDTPRTTCLRRVILRSVLNRPRADLPAGCTERLDKEFFGFLKYVWDFDRTRRPRTEALRLAIGPLIPVVHLRSAAQISGFLAGLNRRSAGGTGPLGQLPTAAERASIQIALAEAFVDSAVDYAFIAERIRGYDLNVVEDILYSEVAPVCFSNLETPVPPVWTGFKDEWLLSEIETTLQARARSGTRRAVAKLKIAWLRYSYGYVWKEIMRFID